MEIAEIIEKAGFGVAAAVGLALVLRWILTRVAGTIDTIATEVKLHGERSAAEHQGITTALDTIATKMNDGD